MEMFSMLFIWPAGLSIRTYLPLWRLIAYGPSAYPSKPPASAMDRRPTYGTFLINWRGRRERASKYLGHILPHH
ncbi:hypothetical protein C8R42DRAFT_326210 [Lentinula raphanica]|nr:hypothetical protein C8R42DRAFT_326210 [Lentinula raphanica]